MSVSFEDIDFKNAFVALFLYSRAPSSGFAARFDEVTCSSVTDEEIESCRGKYVDYMHGRCMKIQFRTYPHLDPYLFDREYGARSMIRVRDAILSGASYAKNRN